MVKGWRKRKNDYIKLDSIVSFRDRFMHYEKCEMQKKLLEENIAIKVSLYNWDVVMLIFLSFQPKLW